MGIIEIGRQLFYILRAMSPFLKTGRSDPYFLHRMLTLLKLLVVEKVENRKEIIMIKKSVYFTVE